MVEETKIVDGHKLCSRCKEMKALDDFGKSNKTKCGLRGDCKKCRNARRLLNRERIISLNKLWYDRNKEKVNAKRKSPENRKKARDYKALNAEKYNRLRGLYRSREESRKEREKHRDKINARKILNYHVSKGHIIKFDACQECGSKERIHGHHENYSKPLEVIWLCNKCHQRRHRKND